MSRKQMIPLILTLLLIVMSTAAPAAAQENPVVFAVLFYSPTCPHCHELISNTLPPIQEEFGDQLVVLYVDVSTEGGSMLAQSAYSYYEIPREQWVVPMMVVNEQVLIGGAEIPNNLPTITRTGLDNGGIPLPAFPGLVEAYNAAVEQSGGGTQSNDTAANDSSADSDEVVGPAEPASDVSTSNESAATNNVESMTLQERLEADPANTLALITLVGLVVSLGVVLFGGFFNQRELIEKLTLPAALVLIVSGGLVAISLVLESGGDTLATVIAWGMLIGLVAVGVMTALEPTRIRRIIPLVLLVGMADAIYLSYVELTHTSAACGAVGNCNVVQGSAYANLFGILPIGVLGVAGYVVMIGLWWLSRSETARTAELAWSGLLLTALFGTIFSIYLTFLEPFVIGATCMWCLLSALMMMLMLWLVAVEGWDALRNQPESKQTPEPSPA